MIIHSYHLGGEGFLVSTQGGYWGRVSLQNGTEPMVINVSMEELQKLSVNLNNYFAQMYRKAHGLEPPTEPPKAA